MTTNHGVGGSTPSGASISPAPVAQVDRAVGFYPTRRGFESSQALHFLEVPGHHALAFATGRRGPGRLRGIFDIYARSSGDQSGALLRRMPVVRVHPGVPDRLALGERPPL